MSDTPPAWICCQLGAREHYAIPRALHQNNQLAHFITDAWVVPDSLLSRAPLHALQSLRDRYHPDLENASVHQFTRSLIQFELAHRLKRTEGWQQIIARNHWFQAQAIQKLKNLKAQPSFPKQPVLFTYSYAALDLLNYARSQGWYTVLGQIDPGPIEEKIVVQEHFKYPALAPTWQPAPQSYWDNWKLECEIADRIVVNSDWTCQALQQVGVDPSKIDVVPLVYSPPEAARSFQRTYPERFSAERPLRVLFLGQVILRKGIAALIEAAEQLKHEPIEFWIVGSIGIDRQQVQLPNIRWVGSVSRSQVAEFYKAADLFLFPTLSDGFGLTQLEAQAWKLPLIVSGFCGEVVKNQVNGIVLSEVTGEAAAEALWACFKHPQWLALCSRRAIRLDCFSLSTLHHHLQRLSYGSV